MFILFAPILIGFWWKSVHVQQNKFAHNIKNLLLSCTCWILCYEVVNVNLWTAILRLIIGIMFDLQPQQKSWHQKTVHLRNDEKQLWLDGKSRFFDYSKLCSQIYVIFSSPLRTHFRQFRAAICLAISKQYFRLSLLFSSPEPKAPRWAISIPMTPLFVDRHPSVRQH